MCVCLFADDGCVEEKKGWKERTWQVFRPTSCKGDAEAATAVVAPSYLAV